jgi:hypothetical protein
MVVVVGKLGELGGPRQNERGLSINRDCRRLAFVPIYLHNQRQPVVTTLELSSFRYMVNTASYLLNRMAS